MKIGVFDSGVGGLSVANAISKALPSDQIVLREDREHVPYGIKTPDEILSLVKPIFAEMIEEGCRVIVVACNTVSTTSIDNLRELFKVPLIAIEPMVKPAAQITKSRVIAVCATPATLASARYKELKSKYAQHITVLEPDCSGWSAMIEHNKVEDTIITREINEVLLKKADVVVLGCTHYHWIEDKISKLIGERARLLQPEQAIISQLKKVIAPLS